MGADVEGTFTVRLGDSLARDDVSFHSFRCSLDRNSGTIYIPATGEATLSFVGKAGEERAYKGPQVAAKENDYLLVYDPATNEFVLERNHSTFQLKNQRSHSPPIKEKGVISLPPPRPALDNEDDDLSDLEECILRDLGA